MKLLSKPKSYDVTKEQRYLDFSRFRFALTQRNWAGLNYATKELGEEFIQGLYECDERFAIPSDIHGKELKYDFMVDVSVFAAEIPKNKSLIQHLEEFTEMRKEGGEQENKQYKQHLRKLKEYANRIENSSYLYRWTYLNSHHPYAMELKKIVEDNIDREARKISKLFNEKADIVIEKNILEQYRELGKKVNKKDFKEKYRRNKVSLILQLKEKHKVKFALEVDEMAVNISIDFINRVFRYSMSDPQLFYFGMETLNRFFTIHDYNLEKSRIFLLLEQNKKQMDVQLIYSTHRYSKSFLANEFLIKEFNESNLMQASYLSIVDMNISSEYFEREKLDVLKTIAEWALSRMDFDKLKTITYRGNWIHHTAKEFAETFGIKSISIRGSEVIGGTDGEELFVKAVAYDKNGKAYLFPLFDAHDWEELNSLQCAVITYTICLLHDLLQENNYYITDIHSKNEKEASLSLLKNKQQLIDKKDETNTWIQHFGENKTKSVYELHMKYLYRCELGIKYSSLGSAEKKKNRITIKKEEVKREEKTKLEYWVSFHFRRLRKSRTASEEAKRKAQHYGIKRIPLGFTFVSGHKRGEVSEKTSNINIRAIDVLRKTVHKMDQIDEMIKL